MSDRTHTMTPREILKALAANQDVDEIEVVRTLDKADTDLCQAEADGYTLRSTIDSLEHTNDALRRRIADLSSAIRKLWGGARWMKNNLEWQVEKDRMFFSNRDALQWTLVKKRLAEIEEQRKEVWASRRPLMEFVNGQVCVECVHGTNYIHVLDDSRRSGTVLCRKHRCRVYALGGSCEDYQEAKEAKDGNDR